MKSLISRLVALLLISSFAAQASAMDLDDSILAEQIQISVTQYRRVVKDFEHLQESLRKSGVDDASLADYPSVKDFIEKSLNPAERQMTDQFKQYTATFGAKSLKKLAKRSQFSDLVPQ